MGEWVKNIVSWAWDATIGKIFEAFRGMVFSVFEFSMNLVNNGNMEFWQDPTVSAVLSVSQYIGLVVMILSIPFLLSSIIQQLDSLDMKIVLFSVGKTFLFVQGSVLLGLLVFKNGLFFISDMNLNMDVSAIKDSVGGSLMLVLFATIGSVIFMVISLGRCAAMFIHIVSAPLYVPYIMKGDKQKLGEWISMAFVITVTYVLQYILFYLAMISMSGGSLIKSIILMIACFSTKAALQRFGVSMSGGGMHLTSVMYSASALYQGIRMMR